MFHKKGTIGWLIDNKLFEIFEGSTLQVKLLEFEIIDDALPKVLRCAPHCHPLHHAPRSAAFVCAVLGCLVYCLLCACQRLLRLLANV
jgi:hypothetical protein